MTSGNLVDVLLILFYHSWFVKSYVARSKIVEIEAVCIKNEMINKWNINFL